MSKTAKFVTIQLFVSKIRRNHWVSSIPGIRNMQENRGYKGICHKLAQVHSNEDRSG